jgi:LysR family transcriptional regulator, nitrogen assimilation regulatory protein
METRRLEYFLKIVELGSISRAAAQFKVAQPALSQQLAVLEAEMLVTRSVRGVSPTQAGLALYRHAQVLVRHLEQAQAEVSQLAGASSTPVSIGLPLSTACMMSMPLLEEVRRRHANIRLQLLEDLSGSLAEMMLTNRLDLAVLFENKHTENFKMDPLWVEELFLVVPPHSRVSDPTPIREVARMDMVLPSGRNGSRIVLEAALEHVNLEPRLIAELDSIPTLKAAVAQGIGYTVLPWSAIFADVTARKLKAVRIKGKGFVRTVSLCASRTLAPTPAVECVSRLVRELATASAINGKSRGMSLVQPRAVSKGEIM